MDDQTERAAPRALIDALDASTRDIAAGAVSDAGEVQADVRRMLADYELAHPPAVRPSGTSRRAGAA